LEITPDNLTQKHNFMFEIDQSFLLGIISQCKEILNKYEIRDKDQKNNA
jgi:hypothetical protein